MSDLKESYDPTVDYTVIPATQDQYAQTFLTTSAYRLDNVQIKLSKPVSYSGGFVTLGIYATAAGKPTGSALTSVSKNINSLELVATYETFNMSKIALTDATTYALVLSSNVGSPPHAAYWHGKETGAYGDGAAYVTHNTQGSWSAHLNTDLTFKMYGNSLLPAKATTPMPLDLSISQPIDISPTWAYGDAYTDTVNVYFDKDDNPPITKVIDNQDVNIYTPGANLDVDADYYWRVDTTNIYGTTTGEVWKFTTGAAIPVSTPADFLAIANNVSASYYLVNDIDMVGETPSVIGNAGTPFTGIVDGGGFTVSNITINNPATSYQGVFGAISTDGLVFDLTVGVAITGDFNVGGLAGYIENATVTNCHVTGTVDGTGLYVGGFAGYITGTSVVTKCSATPTITNNNFYNGGFVGFVTTGAAISNCYATGDITSSSLIVGGFVGQTAGSITNCYSIGVPDGSPVEGGFCGINSGTITGCYYDSTTSGQSDTGKGIPKTTGDMQKMATFIGWDFELPDIWDLSEDLSYPLFDIMPDIVTNPDPINTASSIGHDGLTLSWDAATPYPANTYDVYFGTTSGSLERIATDRETESITITSPLGWNTIYYWRIDSVDLNRASEGTEWSFTTLVFVPPVPSGGEGGELDGQGGTNMMRVVRRLLVAANNKIFYEDS